MPIGSTFTFTLSRDQLITQAYKKIGVLADQETLPSTLLSDGIFALNLLVRQFSSVLKWQWKTKQSPASITLVANTWVYTSANGLPTDIQALIRASYRDSNAYDWPMEILTTESYEALNNKLQIGDPTKLYLTEHVTVGSQTCYLWPSLASVNTQSVVTGTDANPYKCIRSHTSDSTNKPITGANYLQFWESGGSGAVAWATATAYTAPQLVRLWYRIPVYEFTAASDNPDFEKQCTRVLLYALAADLSDAHRIPLEERRVLSLKSKAAYEDIFESLKPVATDYHNKVSYF